MSSYKKTAYQEKRVAVLSKESQKLRKEITELEDALILHSRFQAEDKESLQGIIRKEIRGSRWEHGGKGKINTYRGSRDLREKTSDMRPKAVKEKESNYQRQKELRCKKDNAANDDLSPSSSYTVHAFARLPSPKIMNDHASGTETKPKIHKNIDHNNFQPTKDTAVNDEKYSSLSNQLNSNQINALKDKILVKASAKMIERKGSATKSSTTKHSTSGHKRVPLSHSDKKLELKESKERRRNDGEVSYSLSFLDTLDLSNEGDKPNIYSNTELINTKDTQLVHEAIVAKDKNDKMVSSQTSHSQSVLDEETIQHRQHSSHSTERDLDSHKWATERKPIFKDSKVDHSKLGHTASALEKEPKQIRNRQSYPTTGANGQLKNKDGKFSHREQDFPELFGVALKESQNKYPILSQNQESNVNVIIPHKIKHPRAEQKDNLNLPKEPYEDVEDGVSLHTKQASSLTAAENYICDEVVKNWLENLSLQSVEKYITLFAEHQMDLNSVKLLTAAQLREMGIHALGPIMKIMKGVQVLNRGSSNELCEERNEELSRFTKYSEETKEEESLSIKIEAPRSIGGEITDEHDLNSTSSESKRDVSSLDQSKLSWKKTADMAEYVNLNDRSPTGDAPPLPLVTVKERMKSKETKGKIKAKEKIPRKDRAIAHTDDTPQEERRVSSRVIKKPPVSAKSNGLSIANEKLKERKKQEELKIQSEEIASARQRQFRDKMAARHTKRRSSSSERESSRREHQTSLNRSFSFIDSEKSQMESKVKSRGLHSSRKSFRKQVSSETDAQDFQYEADLTDTKRVGDDLDISDLTDKLCSLTPKDPDDNKNSASQGTLNLVIVRELKKQLNNIEEHLVQKLDQGSSVSSQAVEKENEEDPDRQISKTNSARERRRQKTCQSVRDSLESNDANQSFLHVGSLMSQHNLRENKFVSENKETEKSASVTGRDLVTDSQSKPKNLEEKDENQLTRIVNKIPNNKEQTKSRADTKTFASLEDRRQLVEELQAEKKISRKIELGVNEISRGKIAVAQEYLRKIEIHKKDICFKDEDLLGSGTFSQVYKGIYQGSEVAIKQLKSSLTSADKNYFSAEVSLLQELRHPHVVMLLGVCTAYTCPVLVLEFMQKGNLHKRIYDLNLPPVSKKDFFQISRDIASGVFYLHNHQPPVLHLDLKSRNILLGIGNRAKVADFGFSKLKHETDLRFSRGSKSKFSHRSPAWMAPELLAAGAITPKADVYSFAIVLLEMLTRELPYSEYSTFQILNNVRSCKRPSIPDGCPRELKHLIEWCWDQNPCTRPTFKAILKDLDNVSQCKEWMIPSAPQNDDLENQSWKNIHEAIFADDNQEKNSYNFKSEFFRDQTSAENFPDITNQLLSQEKKNEGPNKSDDEREKNSENRQVCDQQIHNETSKLFENEKDTVGESEAIPTESFSKRNHQIQSSRFSQEDLSGLSDLFKSISYTESLRSSNDLNKEKNLIINDTKNNAEKFVHKIPTSGVETKENSDLPAESSQLESERISKTELLLNSPKDKNQIDYLLKKYLPSPRSEPQNQKEIGVSDDKHSKLLPLRKSLDKPRKPPKPAIIGKPSLSRSENFSSVPVDSFLPSRSMKANVISKPELRNKAIRSTNYEASADQVMGNLKEDLLSLYDIEEQAIEISNDKTNLSNMADNYKIDSKSPNSMDGKIQEIVGTVLEEEESQVCEADDSKSFRKSPLLKIEPLKLEELNSPRDVEVDKGSSHINNKELKTLDKGAVVKTDTTFKHNSSDTKQLKIDCDSSLSTTMSVDSLSLSLSDSADSIDFPKVHSKSLSQAKKSKKRKTHQRDDDINEGSTDPSSNGAHQDVRSKYDGNVRESFFLFNDFHLDLSLLNMEGNKPDSPIKKSELKKSPVKKIHSESTKFTGSNSSLKLTKQEDILRKKEEKTQDMHINKQKNKESLQIQNEQDKNIIPPAPALKGFQLSLHKEKLRPVKSGVPSKSAATRPEVKGHSRFSVEPALLLQQRQKLKSVLPEDLSPVGVTSLGKSVPSVANILKKAMDERRVAMGDNQDSQELTTPEASWSIQD